MSISSDQLSLRVAGKRTLLRLRYDAIGILAAALDIALLIAASCAAGISYHLLAFDELGEPRQFLSVGVLSAALYCLILYARGLYKPSALLMKRPQLRRLSIAWSFSIAMTISILF